MEDAYGLAMRCPVLRRDDSYSGFPMELENRVGDGKGKGSRGRPTRLKVPTHRSGAHSFVVARKRVMPAERRRQVPHVVIESTGNRRNSISWRKAVAFMGWHEPDESRGSRPDP
jgi:hypothetical protein